MKIAVLSDIHANRYALEEALRVVDGVGYDLLVFLGDLLTYGVDCRATIEIVADRTSRRDAILIRGNHDQLYDDILQRKSVPYLDSLPGWIVDSVELTAHGISETAWVDLDFVDDYEVDEILLSHANPFSRGDWTYLNSRELLEEAARIIKGAGNRVGVFGHTHRASHFAYSGIGCSHFSESRSMSLSFDQIHVLNPGSIGQPRDAFNPKSSFLWIDSDYYRTSEGLEIAHSFSINDFDYNSAMHCQSIRNSTLGSATKDRLLSFFG